MDCALTRSFSLKNKVIIVTGGATGLGKEYSLALAAAGARLVVTDLQRDAIDDLVSTIHRYNAEAVGVAGDISEASTAELLIDATKKAYGHLDGLINNAGLMSALALKNWSEITGDEWDKCMAVNLKGAFFCAKAAASEMRATGGSIVNISSGRFFDGGTLRLHYTASKAGIVGLTRGLARELGQFNIRVNCIAPGIVVSDTLKKTVDENFFREHADGRCLKRPMYASDLIGAIGFLLSDSSSFITGQVMSIDGGKNFH